MTPEGQLASDKGVYVAEVVRDKNVRQARGRMKMYDDGLDQDVSVYMQACVYVCER